MNLVDKITEWLRQFITALLLAGFIEMLIPENSLKKPVKLVIGLLVMVILVQPLARIFKVPLELDRILSASHGANHQTSQQVLECGLQIRNNWQERFDSQQRILTKEKIESVIGLIDGIDLREVRFAESKSGFTRVNIRVVPAFNETFSKIDQDKFTNKIQNSVRLVSDLSKEQIEVNWDEN